MYLTTPFILASRSPRRKKLLALLEIPFEVAAAEVREQRLPGESPRGMVSRLALKKACTIAKENPSSMVLGADTIVVVDDSILGKPATVEEAASMLSLLSGRTHTVMTAVAVVIAGASRTSVAVESTDVTFALLSETEIDSYIRTSSPFDKAGAYGIQDDRGALFISGIKGDFYNVMGLPIHRLYNLLRSDFADLISESEKPSSSASNP